MAVKEPERIGKCMVITGNLKLDFGAKQASNENYL
jgi:hypothetical protein